MALISIIIPFHNEQENLELLCREIEEVLEDREYEVIFVDDGSTDGSIKKLADQHNKVKTLSHRKRLGKGAALLTGLSKVKGEVIFFMDADLQDDPHDIPLMLEKLESGYDVVNGWRKKRKERTLMNIISKIGNTVLWKLFLNSRLHDVNCGFKAFKREVLEEIPLYGDNFRFIPLIAEQKGYRVSEIIVHHRPRLHGTSKYTVTKAFFGLFDTFTTYFIFRFSEKPLHFFGLIGGSFFASGFIVAMYLSYERIFHRVLLYRRPALLFAILLIIVGIQIVLTGVVAELMVYLDKKKSSKK